MNRMKVELELTRNEALALDKILENFENKVRELKNSPPKGFGIGECYDALTACAKVRPEISLQPILGGTELHPSEVG